MPELAKKVVKKATKKVVKKAATVKKTAAKAVKKTAVKKVAAVKKPLAKKVAVKKIEDTQAVTATVEVLAQPESPSNPVIDWDAMKKKYNIAGYTPEKLKIVPRDSFIQAIAGNDSNERAVEDVIAQNPEQDYTAAAKEIRDLSHTYIKLRNNDARLPRFGKWVNSLFPSNQDYQRIISQRGQTASIGALQISADIVDVLRGGDVPGSCLNDRGGFTDVLKAVVQEAPGIGVAFINDPTTGKMAGRLWLHHAKIVATGEDVVVAASMVYGHRFTHQQVADYLAERGYRLFMYDPYGYYGNGNNRGEEQKIEFVNCLDRSIHWDTYTWGQYKTVKAYEIKPTMKKLNKAA